MTIGTTLWIIIQILIGYNLLLPLFLYCISLFGKKKVFAFNQLEKEADYAIIVTAYEQTNFIVPVVKSLLRLNYSNYTIYIIADKCDVSNLSFEDPRIILLRP